MILRSFFHLGYKLELENPIQNSHPSGTSISSVPSGSSPVVKINFDSLEINSVNKKTLVNSVKRAILKLGNPEITTSSYKNIKVWFLDKNTKMNPNMEYSQMCGYIGTGLIDFKDMYYLIDSIKLIYKFELLFIKLNFY